MMKKYLLIALLFASAVANAQHTEWRTGIRDTSYSSKSDYAKNIKIYPFIKLVPEQAMPNVTEQRGLVYAALGERKLHIDVFTPKQVKKSPAILIIHGGGWRSGDRSQHIPLAQHLAAQGIASFTVEYRLSTEAFYPAAVYDVKAALRWLHANATKFNIDTNKIAVLGFSAGGQLAALTGMTTGFKKLEGDEGVTNYSSNVQAVIDIDGTLSFVAPEASETKNMQNIGASAWWIGYPRTERLDLWTEASPFTYAADNKKPFLFLNSSLERMHVGRDEFKKMMDERNVYTEIRAFKDSPHAFCLYEPWFEPTVQYIKTFIDNVFKSK